MGRKAGWAFAALIAIAGAYVVLGPRMVLRDPATVLASSGWNSAIATGEEERIRRIVEAFFAGFNTMVARGTGERVRDTCEGVGALYKPFCYEGSAAGYLPRGYFRWGYGLSRAEEALDATDPGHTLLHYVGLGVWAGLRNGAGPESASRIADGVRDRRHRSLVWNGYGFAHAALLPRDAAPGEGPEPCRAVAAPGAAACAHGYGRGLWFRHMGDEAGALRVCGPPEDPLSGACVTGVGLASAFVHPDRMDHLLEAKDRVPEDRREEFLQGVRAALLVRHQSDARYLEESIEALQPPRREEARVLLERALACYGETIERETFYDDFMACR